MSIIGLIGALVPGIHNPTQIKLESENFSPKKKHILARGRKEIKDLIP